MNVSQSAHIHVPKGERERGRPSAASRGSITRLGLDGLDVFGAVRRLVLGLLVLHGVDDLDVAKPSCRLATRSNLSAFHWILLIWPRDALTRRF